VSQSSATCIETPQTRCRAAIARCDITPPVGIYHRMWGAATHDRAMGVHRPLLATLLWLESLAGDSAQALVIVALDHCILDGPDVKAMERAVAISANIRPEQVLISLAHTHAAGLMSRSRSALPGGELIGPYLDDIATKLGQLAAQAALARQQATIVYGQGRSNLAANRDFHDPQRDRIVCGFNPSGPADDTLLVAKVVGKSGNLVATVVNYACHPTTLAWQNMLISPDYVGALRETVEQHTAAPCLFLQGASADLGPREGFVGDTAIADRNGRQLAFAALAALEGFPQPETQFRYAGPVISGATIGTWKHEPMDAAALESSAAWKVARWNTPLDYRPDLPSVAQAQADLDQLVGWAPPTTADKGTCESRSEPRPDQARDRHARVEQATRQLWRLSALPPNHFPLPVTLARLGHAFWLFVAGEHYQSLQTSLRHRFPNQPIVVATLTGGWQPGYIPPVTAYGRGIYQEQVAVVAAGSAELLLQSICERITDQTGGARRRTNS
jgi:hypothetical protein